MPKKHHPVPYKAHEAKAKVYEDTRNMTGPKYSTVDTSFRKRLTAHGPGMNAVRTLRGKGGRRRRTRRGGALGKIGERLGVLEGDVQGLKRDLDAGNVPVLNILQTVEDTLKDVPAGPQGVLPAPGSKGAGTDAFIRDIKAKVAAGDEAGARRLLNTLLTALYAMFRRWRGAGGRSKKH